MTRFFRPSRNFYVGAAIMLTLATILVFMNPQHKPPATPMPVSHVTVKTALKAGEKAPDFTLRDHEGNPLTLSLALIDGPVVVTFFRGNWCPICAAQLKALDIEIEKFKDLGAQVVAISAQLPDETAQTHARFGITMPILSDTGMAVTKLYGVEWQMPEAIRLKTEEFLQAKQQKTLADYQGDAGLSLPVPATYVIAQDGTVVYAFADKDYKQRAHPTTLLQALQAIQ